MSEREREREGAREREGETVSCKFINFYGN